MSATIRRIGKNRNTTAEASLSEPLAGGHVGGFEQCRVAGYIFDPKLPHHPLHILSAEANSIRMFVAELTRSRVPRIWVARVWRKGRSSRLMNDALRRNIELVPSD